jgi:hypothetical protein
VAEKQVLSIDVYFGWVDTRTELNAETLTGGALQRDGWKPVPRDRTGDAPARYERATEDFDRALEEAYAIVGKALAERLAQDRPLASPARPEALMEAYRIVGSWVVTPNSP